MFWAFATVFIICVSVCYMWDRYFQYLETTSEISLLETRQVDEYEDDIDLEPDYID